MSVDLHIASSGEKFVDGGVECAGREEVQRDAEM